MRFTDLSRGLPYLFLALAAGCALFGHRLDYDVAIWAWGFQAPIIWLSFIAWGIAGKLRSEAVWLLAAFLNLFLVILAGLWAMERTTVAPTVIIAALLILASGWALYRDHGPAPKGTETAAIATTPWYLQANIPLGLLVLTFAGNWIEILTNPPNCRGLMFVEAVERVNGLTLVSKLTFSANTSPETQLILLTAGAAVALYGSCRYSLPAWAPWILLATTTDNGRLWLPLWDKSPDDLSWIRYSNLLWRLDIALWLTAACLVVYRLRALVRKFKDTVQQN